MGMTPDMLQIALMPAIRPELAHGQLDLRFQPAERAVPNLSASAGGENSLLTVRPPFDWVAPCLVSSLINSPSPAQR